MWQNNFEDRLLQWRELRTSTSQVPLNIALMRINDWWFQAPWKPYYLHWDDREFWPDPWDLLADNHYCDLARALGIVYTIMMIDSISNHPVEIVETAESNLVLVDDGKYILNWAPREMLNIHSTPLTQVRHRMSGESFRHLLR